MDPVAEAPSDGVAGLARNGDGPHDLADLALAAEEEAARGHPLPNVRRIGVELERSGVDQRAVVPGRRDLSRDDVQDVDPPRRALDDLEAAIAALRDVVLDDGRDPDPHDLHRCDGSSGPIGGTGAPKGIRTPDLHLERVAS